MWLAFSVDFMPETGDAGDMSARAPGSEGWEGMMRAREAQGWLAQLSPSYFGLVMATGIVSIAAGLMDHPLIAGGLFVVNLIQYGVLWLLYGLRMWRYPRRFFGDMFAHASGSGYFTVVAGTGILASQMMTLNGPLSVGVVLWGFELFLWFVLTYTIFTAFTVRSDKPPIEKAINGGWLLAVVATQSVSVTSALLAVRVEPWRTVLDLLALTMWLWGGMLYIWLISIIFYRHTFFRVTPDELTPPYWINMGAMAISTLAGSLLVINADIDPFLSSLQPYLKGMTVLYWATGTWWIPILLLLGLWRYVWQRYPVIYDPLYWGVVFPLGMYSTCTREMQQAMSFDVLGDLSYALFYLALAAWVVTFAAMLGGLVQAVRVRSG